VYTTWMVSRLPDPRQETPPVVPPGGPDALMEACTVSRPPIHPPSPAGQEEGRRVEKKPESMVAAESEMIRRGMIFPAGPR